MKKITAVLLAAAALGLASCNTVEGVGKDVQSVGKTVEGAAN